MLMLLIMLLGANLALAQSGGENSNSLFSGRGIILDDFANPVSGVLVKIGGDSVGISNNEGYVDLTTGNNSVLTFEHPLFYKRTYSLQKHEYIPVAGRDSVQNVTNFFTVRLSASYLQQRDRISVLYGDTERKRNTGAVSSATTGQVSTTLGPTLAYSLAGRLPGLYLSQVRGFRNPVTDNNYRPDLGGNIPRTFLGAPSDNTEFLIALRGQSPVVVIDGVQRDIFSIDPENIESVSVLKDALSSLFLGMRSSRGVLLIKTKQPNADGFRLSFTGQMGVQTPLSMPEPLPAFQYAYLLNEALQNDGRSPIYTNEDLAAFRNGTDPVGHPDVNWYKTILRESAPVSSYNLNVSGGGNVARYSISGSFMDQQGLFKTSDRNSYETNAGLKRYLISSNVAVDVTDRFTIDVSLFARIQDAVQPGAGMNALLSQLLITPNNAYPVINPNGSYGGNVSYQQNLMALATNSGYIQDNSRDAIANIGLDYDLEKFVKGLSVRALTNVSTQNITALIRNKQNTVFEYRPSSSGEGGTYTQYGSAVPQSNSFSPVSSARFWYGQVSLDYNRSFGAHTLGGKLLADQRIVTINYDLPQKPANLAARVQYDFRGKYFVDAAFTRSHHNGYAEGKQWGSFYAFGLGWDIAREAFLRNSRINELKLRGVFGRTGSGIDNAGYYIFRQTYSQTFTDGTYDQGFSRSIGTGMTENAPLANPNITWEKADKLNVGVDVSVLHNHLRFTADYYYDHYFDLLQVRGKSIALIGFTYPQENIGKTLYKGTELSATYQNNIGNFNYFITGNWSQMASKIVFQDEQARLYSYNRVTGQPVGHFYGYVAEGLFSSQAEAASAAKLEGVAVQPGDIRYKDLNEDGAINQYDQTVIGNDKPLSYYGLTGGFSLKGFDVSVLLQGVYNRDIYVMNSAVDAGFAVIGQAYGQAYEQILGRWTPETAATATYPRLTAGNNINNTQASSFWVRSGDYFRVRNLSVGYTLPFKLSNRFNISQVRLFLNGQNLFTKADDEYVDPEVTSVTSYPVLKVVSAGLNIKL